MEDNKNFYKSKLQRDNTILRTAANTLKTLVNRFPFDSMVMEELGKQLIGISDALLSQGWRGYIPKPKPIAEVAIDDTLDVIAFAKAESIQKEADEKAEELRLKEEAEAEKKAEALAEKQRVADEKAKVAADKKAATAAKKAAKLKELEELKAAKLLELEALDELKEETEEA